MHVGAVGHVPDFFGSPGTGAQAFSPPRGRRTHIRIARYAGRFPGAGRTWAGVSALSGPVSGSPAQDGFAFRCPGPQKARTPVPAFGIARVPVDPQRARPTTNPATSPSWRARGRGPRVAGGRLVSRTSRGRHAAPVPDRPRSRGDRLRPSFTIHWSLHDDLPELRQVVVRVAAHVESSGRHQTRLPSNRDRSPPLPARCGPSAPGRSNRGRNGQGAASSCRGGRCRTPWRTPSRRSGRHGRCPVGAAA